MPWLPDRLKQIAIVGSTAPLPRPLRLTTREAWLAHLQLAKARRADVIVVPHPKTGGTWLRVMLSRLYQRRHGLPERRVVKSDELARRDPALPRFLFTNGHYTYEGAVGRWIDSPESRPALTGKKLVLLARHPADVAVSWYLQFTRRIKAYKRELIERGLRHAIDPASISLWDFVRHDELGLPALVDFFNAWERRLAGLPSSLVLRYEDLRAEPARELARLVRHLGEDFGPEEIDEAVRFGSFENLRALERQGFFRNSGLSPRKARGRSISKVRRGKVGGYRDYFAAEQIAWIDSLVAERLSPTLGYGPGGIARELSA